MKFLIRSSERLQLLLEAAGDRGMNTASIIIIIIIIIDFKNTENSHHRHTVKKLKWNIN